MTYDEYIAQEQSVFSGFVLVPDDLERLQETIIQGTSSAAGWKNTSNSNFGKPVADEAVADLTAYQVEMFSCERQVPRHNFGQVL